MERPRSKMSPRTKLVYIVCSECGHVACTIRKIVEVRCTHCKAWTRAFEERPEDRCQQG